VCRTAAHWNAPCRAHELVTSLMNVGCITRTSPVAVACIHVLQECVAAARFTHTEYPVDKFFCSSVALCQRVAALDGSVLHRG